MTKWIQNGTGIGKAVLGATRAADWVERLTRTGRGPRTPLAARGSFPAPCLSRSALLTRRLASQTPPVARSHAAAPPGTSRLPPTQNASHRLDTPRTLPASRLTLHGSSGGTVFFFWIRLWIPHLQDSCLKPFNDLWTCFWEKSYKM